MKLVGGWPGRIVIGQNGRFGVRPDEFAVGGDFDNPLEACVDPGDENTEFAWVITELPTDGTITAGDTGAFTHTDAADGSYVTTFRLYTWAPGGPAVDEGTAPINTSFGDNSTAAGVILTSAATLVLGAASGAADAPGATLTAGASLVVGSATGEAAASGATLTGLSDLILGSATGAADAPGATLTSGATLVLGGASGGGVGTADGATLTSDATLIAGTAVGEAAAAGATLTAGGALVVGSATGEAVAAGVTLEALGELVSGTATGGAGGGGTCDPAEIWNYVLANGKTAAQTLIENNEMLRLLVRIHGLEMGTPLVNTSTSRSAGSIEQTITVEGAGNDKTVTVERTA